MTDEPVAIVGASCRFPGAEDLEGFWRLLKSGGDAVTEIGAERWSTRFYYHPDRNAPGKSYTWSAGLISGVDLFEPAFFGISPREAAQMDPQQRLLLELVWHAFEDAGLPTSRLAGSTTGVFVGASATDYSDLRLGDPAGADSHFMTGNTLSILANRISYVFDLHGPSLTIDTACSSSLVALHHACEAIRAGRIESAIVGGINLLLAPYPFIGFSRASMLSRRGRCFAFDERADGYVRAEGGGVVILKPLAAARADGDAVRAVIYATGVNSDGRTVGLSLPSEAAQAALLRSVYERAGIAPEALAFFEMHGTGTPAGDPIEAAAVGHALGQRRSQPLPIGSVKSNIGHLEPASGMAGLLKAALALERHALPPSLHCGTPNPRIPFAELNLSLVREVRMLAAAPAPFAGVNSFGFGGTNAHAVLSAPPPHREEASPAPMPVPPLLVSAATEESLRRLAASWRATLAQTAARDAPALLRAAARGRDHHPHRLMAFGRDTAELSEALGQYLENAEAQKLISGSALREGKLAFVFSGNGAQFPGMGRVALRANAAFRAGVEEVDALLLPQLGWSLAERLDAQVGGDDVARADVAQPLLFAIQVGVVRALRAAGITACGHFGHSVGEIAAAWAAGALSLADAGRVVVARSRCQQRTQGAGGMAALALGCEAARDFLAELDSAAEIGAINTLHSVTISGDCDDIERCEVEARYRGVWFRRLDLDFAFHSRQMDPIREELLAKLEGLQSRPPASRLVSTVTGAAIEGESLDAEYWWRNIRRPVRFAEASAQMIGAGYRIFLEIGPSAILQSYLNDALRTADVDGRALPSLSRTAGEGDPFPTIAARAYVAGYDLTGAPGFSGRIEPRGAPLYPWVRDRFWFEQTTESPDLANPPYDHPLLGFRREGPVHCWRNHLDEQVLPWIADHAVDGMPVFPAAAIIETACAAARWRWPEATALELFDAEVRRPLPFDKGRMRELRTTLGGEDDEWEFASRPRLSSEPFTLHAVGRIAAATDPRPLLRWRDARETRRQIESETLYHIARQSGLDYGPRFRTVARIEIVGDGEAVAALDDAAIDEPIDPYLIHPALLDGALQSLFGLLAERSGVAAGVGFLPWRFGRVRLLAPFGRVPRTARVRLTRLGTRSACADLALLDEAGELVAELADCWFRRVELTRRVAPDELALRVDLVPAPLSKPDAPDALRTIVDSLPRLVGEGEPDRRRQEQALLLDALVGAMAAQSFREIVPTDGAFTLDELVASGRLSPLARGIAQSLLNLLDRLGAATQGEGGWKLELESGLPDAAELWQLLLGEAPDLVAELSLLAGAMQGLPKLLAAGPLPADGPRLPAAEQFLQASPATAAGVDLICETITQIAALWPAGRSLRVIEIGAADGDTTRRLLDRLAQSGVPFTYLATAADPEQSARLAFAVEPYVEDGVRLWSPADGPETLDGAAFDVMVALNACTRLQPDASSLLRLLAAGGLFLAVEPEPNALWDVALGQTSAWWQNAESEASPLRSGEGWRLELAIAGFEDAGSAAIAAGPWPISLFWGRAPAAATPDRVEPKEAVGVRLVSAGTALAAALAAQLAEAGHRVTLASPETWAANDIGPGENVVFLAETPDRGDATDRAARQITALTRIAAAAAERSAPLWVVTCDAQQPAPADADAAPTGGANWGIARVLVNEMPRLSLRLVDLASATPVAEQARRLRAELTGETPEREIVWTAHGRHAPRLRPGLPPRWARPEDVLELSHGQAGGLEALGWKVAAPRPVGPGEVEIEVHAAGLNFRDMMWAMGLLPEEALIDGYFGANFGLECAGVVRSLGPGVENLRVGDRVMALAPASLASRVVAISEAAAPIPPGIDFAAAATIPVAFVTATYALGHLARLEAGEYVLIHAAAGGVGLAAIQYAKQCGAIVIATAGSEVKRAFLRLAGADHVLDFARSRFRRRRARDHPRPGCRCRAQFAERRGDGAQPGGFEAVRAFSRTRQARFLSEPAHPSTAAAAERVLFRDRRRPAADPTAGACALPSG